MCAHSDYACIYGKQTNSFSSKPPSYTHIFTYKFYLLYSSVVIEVKLKGLICRLAHSDTYYIVYVLHAQVG